MAEVLTTRGFEKLVADLSGLLDAGRAEAEAAVASVLAQTYWKVGRRVLDEALTDRAGYGSATLQRLATELAVEHRTLERAVQFARVYPELPEAGLSWAHYRELIRVHDDGARRWYEAQALSEGWSTRTLVSRVRGEVYEQHKQAASKDTDKAKGPGLSRPKTATYVYACVVERVIDGDTLLTRVDLGFEVWKEQVIRLAGLDAEPIETDAGKAAAAMVVDRLARAEQVVLKTEQHDIHMRYVAHVFYSHRPMSAADVFAKGRYLNAELLAKGLARKA